KPDLAAAVLRLVDPTAAVTVLSSVDPAALQDFDFDEAFGDSKYEVLGGALEAIAKKTLAPNGDLDRRTQFDHALFDRLATTMLATKKGKKTLAANLELAGTVLSSMDPDTLKDVDFDGFGQAKKNVLAQALRVISDKPGPKDGNDNRNVAFDPELFTLRAKKVEQEVWNDQTARPDPRKGLGPFVIRGLWHTGHYDEICQLIEHGVDTSLAANVGVKVKGPGIYSGFIQPIQHVIQNHLRDIDKLGTTEASTWDQERKSKVKGAKKIFQALEEEDKAVTLTKWSEVENSDMIKEFKKKPGTIWGFENVRMPYVQGAHGTKHGAQPLRMMELWEVMTNITVPSVYNKL